MRKLLRIHCLAVCLSLICVVLLGAQEKTAEEALKGFPEFVEKLRQEWEVPGLAVGIVKDGKLIFAQGFGYRDVEKELPVTPKTLFAIGSCSKAFTAMAVAMLVEEGKVKWDEPVRTYLPDFTLYDEYATLHMTPRDLVCHRSGLPRHDGVWYGSSATRDEIFHRLAYLEPTEDLRDVWQYNNLMFMTAGYLVGKVSGTSWEKFTRARILDPLGMKRSNFSVTDSQKDEDFSQPYALKDDKVEKVPFRNIDNIGPAGSINSCAEEMAGWLILNLGKGKFGEEQVVSESQAGGLHTPQMVIRSLGEYEESFMPAYAMGWLVGHYRGYQLLAHGGGIDGFISQVSFMPRQNIGVVVLTNLAPNSATSSIMFNAYDRLLGLPEIDWNARAQEQWKKAQEAQKKAKEDRFAGRKEGTTPSHPLADYAGKYGNPGYGEAEIVLDGERLKVTYNSLSTYLEHFHYDVFIAADDSDYAGSKLTFVLDDKGDVEKVTTPFQEGVKPIEFTRIAEESLSTAEYLQKFVGEYEFIGITARVELRGENTLCLTVPGQPEYELVPVRENEFKIKDLEGFSITFTLDAEGNVIEALSHQPDGTYTAKRIK
jgi:CubicO group peptidase (beta-lactamase class C family)